MTASILKEHPFIDYSYCNCMICLGFGDVENVPCECTEILPGSKLHKNLIKQAMMAQS